MIGGGDPTPLRARGLIGDTGTAALVAADGTIDWWCPGRFDAPAAFFRLLEPAGGALRVGPAGAPQPGRQSYDDRTNVLRTILPAPEAEIEVTDFMPWDGRRPSGRIVRIVTARHGRAEIEVKVVPGCRWAPARDVSSWSEGIAFDGVVVHTGLPMVERRATVVLEAGDRMVVTVDGPRSTDDRPSAALSVGGALELADRTAAAWRRHLAPLAYGGPYRDQVERSLLVLQALTSAASGAVVASPTTSLPQRVGGERNFDHRLAWVRDSALALELTADLGLPEPADGLAVWISHVVEDASLPLRTVSAPDGGRAPEEQELRLSGFRRSQPVREGCSAGDRLQFDAYADLAACLHPDALRRNRVLLDQWSRLSGLADWLADHWHEPDIGVWENRGPSRPLLSSRLSCWFTLDRMADMARARSPLDLAVIGWREAARSIRADVEGHGLFRHGGLRRDASDDDALDAALLRLAWRGPWPVDDPRVVSTVDRVLEDLSDGAFVHRYPAQVDDGCPPGQGASVACSFWAVEALAALGRWDDAHARMEAMCAFGRPLWLLPDQAEPATREFLGNLPEALSHLALLRAALALERGPV